MVVATVVATEDDLEATTEDAQGQDQDHQGDQGRDHETTDAIEEVIPAMKDEADPARDPVLESDPGPDPENLLPALHLAQSNHLSAKSDSRQWP